jgi:hypothetical protein
MALEVSATVSNFGMPRVLAKSLIARTHPQSSLIQKI